EEGHGGGEGHQEPAAEVDGGPLREPAGQGRRQVVEGGCVMLPEVPVRHASLGDQPGRVEMLTLVGVEGAVEDDSQPDDAGEGEERREHQGSCQRQAALPPRAGREGLPPPVSAASRLTAAGPTPYNATT